jgi:hypothetical protein
MELFSLFKYKHSFFSFVQARLAFSNFLKHAQDFLNLQP